MFASEIFRFRGRGSIVLPPLEHSNFQGSPRGGCRHDPLTCGAEEKTADRIPYQLPVSPTTLQKWNLVWRLSNMTLWTGFKQQHSVYDDTKSAQAKKKKMLPLCLFFAKRPKMLKYYGKTF